MTRLKSSSSSRSTPALSRPSKIASRAALSGGRSSGFPGCPAISVRPGELMRQLASIEVTRSVYFLDIPLVMCARQNQIESLTKQTHLSEHFSAPALRYIKEVLHP